MAALDLVKTLIAAGVTFEADGERIRWRNAEGKIDGSAVEELRKGKAEIIAFLNDNNRTLEKRTDAEIYADALRLHGPMSYGMAMRVLGWGGTRAGQAEDALRKAGRITFNKQGRAVLRG